MKTTIRALLILAVGGSLASAQSIIVGPDTPSVYGPGEFSTPSFRYDSPTFHYNPPDLVVYPANSGNAPVMALVAYTRIKLDGSHIQVDAFDSTAVPEPSSSLILLGGLGLLACQQCRRRGLQTIRAR